jgi:hypothetical protein
MTVNAVYLRRGQRDADPCTVELIFWRCGDLRKRLVESGRKEPLPSCLSLLKGWNSSKTLGTKLVFSFLIIVYINDLDGMGGMGMGFEKAQGLLAKGATMGYIHP